LQFEVKLNAPFLCDFLGWLGTCNRSVILQIIFFAKCNLYMCWTWWMLNVNICIKSFANLLNVSLCSSNCKQCLTGAVPWRVLCK
jgi:hypothetical protein